MGLAERIAAAEARAAAAEKAVSAPEFVAEMEARERLAKARDREVAAYTSLRDAVAVRMLDAYEPGKAAAVKFDAPGAHVFVVQAAGGAAFKAWQQGIRDAAIKKQVKGGRGAVDLDDVNRTYTVAGVAAWASGTQSADGEWAWTEHDIDGDSEEGAKLNALLRDQPAMLTRIQDTISGLDGAAADEVKS